MTEGGPERIATVSSYVPQAVLRRLATLSGAPDGPYVERFPAALLLVDINGFTSLTAAAVRRGPAGTEALSRALNSYLGQIIDVVAEHGGDIAKIVGDALLPVWPALDEDLATVSRRAAVCGLAIASELGELEVENDLRLSVKVGLCAGDVAATHVGGLDGRWLFLVAGEGISQLSELEQHMRTGDVVASPEAWTVVSSRFVGQPIEGGHVRIAMTRQDLEPRPLTAIHLPAEAEALVRSYIPRVVLGRVDAGQADWLAELRRTTVLFASVRGVGNATPDAVDMLGRVTWAAQGVLGRYDGWLKEITMDDKGTTLVAAFGVPPFSHEDDPARAVRAALTIQSELRGLGLTAGVGVTTGQAICGPVGNARRRDFAVLGGQVNLAARLMQASNDDDVLCDAETHDGAGDGHQFERLPAYVLKGIPGPIDVFRVRSAEAAAEAPPAFVGRAAEMAAATAAVENLARGTGALVVVEGEPGIGKSRFVGEWLDRARPAGVRTLVGEAAEIESATPYHAWRPILDRAFGLEAIVDRSLRGARVVDRLRADESAVRLAPLLDPILSLDLPENDSTRQLEGEVRADNTRDMLVGVLREEASIAPLMIVLEDVHWLDSASWSLLLRVRREVASILLVVTIRPAGADSDPIASIRDEATTLRLGQLSREDALALACQRTGAHTIADQVADVVHARAEGNPLFIEQLTYAMRDAGRIVVDNGVCRPASGTDNLEGAIIPDTVQRVITTRLDQLPPAEAMTLKVASVIGERFALRTLVDIYPLQVDRRVLVDHLETLTRLDLVAPASGAPEPSYDFRHVITQEVAYNLMLSTQSQELHRKLAEWFERTYADDLSPFHAFLAYHWRKAGLAARAVDHLEQAGIQALETFANEEGIDFLEAALSLESSAKVGLEASRRASWRLQLGGAYVNMSRYREGRDHLEAGLHLMGQPAPTTGRRQVMSLVAEILRQGLRRIGIGRGVRRMSDEERAAIVPVFRAYERLAEASYYGNETLLPLYCVMRILNQAEASGIPAEIARGFAGTGALFGLVPLPRVAEWYLQRALERLDEVEDATTHEIVGIVVGFYFVGAGRWELAREHFRTVRRIARRLGDRRRLDDAVANMAELEYLHGSFRTAVDLADELIASAGARHDDRFRADGLFGAAYGSWQLGDTDRAAETVASLREVMSSGADITDELRIKTAGLSALVYFGRGERQQAQAAGEEAMRLVGGGRPTYFGTFLGYTGPAEMYLDLWESGHPSGETRTRAAEAVSRMKRFGGVFPIGRPRSLLLEGRHDWLRERQGPAFRSWRRALVKAEELSMDYEIGLAHFEIGRHLEHSDPDRAGHLRNASEIFGRLGAAQAVARVAEATSGATGP